MSKELKRCPFCGGEAYKYIDDGLYHVACKSCDTSYYNSESYEDAIEGWNDRPIEQLLTEAVEILDATKTQGGLLPWMESMISDFLSKQEIKAIQEN